MTERIRIENEILHLSAILGAPRPQQEHGMKDIKFCCGAIAVISGGIFTFIVAIEIALWIGTLLGTELR